MAWLQGWTYRKKADVTNTVTNYQKKLTLHTGGGTDTDTDVYNVKAKNDWSDIRFTEYDGETLLNYWIEEKLNGDHAVVWVKLPSVWVPENALIYLYYGNAAATDQSDPDATFIFFDDFNDASIDPNKWDVGTQGQGGSYTEAGGSLQLTSSDGYTGSAWAKNKTSFQNDIIIQYSAKATEEHYNDVVFGFGSIVDIVCGTSAWWHTLFDSSYGNLIQDETNLIYRLLNCPVSENKENNITGPKLTDFKEFKIVYTSNGEWDWYYYNNGWQKLGTGQTDSTHLSSNKYLLFSRGGYSAEPRGGTFHIDWAYIRKYASPAPVFTWGIEETVIKTLEILYHAFTDQDLDIRYHSYTDVHLDIQYHAAVDQDLDIRYHVYADTAIALEILYHALVDKTLNIRYHAWEYIDFLLEISVQGSISADCDTATVIIPNDQLVNISNYDVGNGEWVLEKKINGVWIRQFCGRCKETFLRSPPPRIEFKLYDYTIFLTQYYYTGIHNQIEAAKILRGYGSQTQILNLDSDAGNWTSSGSAVVSDEDTIKQEGTGSLKAVCTAESQWVARIINDDWSSFGRVTFWMRSSQQLMVFALKIVDGSGNWRRYNLKTLDTSDEWKEYYVDFCRPDYSHGEDMNWASINYITFESLGTGIYYLDDIRGEEGVQDKNGNFANGILFDMNISPAGIEYTGVNLTIQWTQTKRIDCARDVRDEVSTIKDQPWEFYVDEWKTAYLTKRKEQKEVITEVDEETLVTCDIKISWW